MEQSSVHILNKAAFIDKVQRYSDDLYYSHIDVIVAFQASNTHQAKNDAFVATCEKVKLVEHLGMMSESSYMTHLCVPAGNQNKVRTIQHVIKQLFQLIKEGDRLAYKFVGSCKMGISVIGFDSHSIQSAVTHAFQATMEQENKRQQRVSFFDSKLQFEVKRQLLLEEVVSMAIDNNNVDIVYQPIVNCHSWEIGGYEILSRFKCDSALKASTRELISVIEDLNLISELDLLTYHKALVELGDIIKNNNVFININVSANTRQDFSELFDCINLLTTQYKLDHSRLVIDINPPKEISEIENCIAHFGKLTSKGASIVLADLPFGFDLGAQLERGNFNFLRIDEQFCHKFHEEKEYYQVVKLLISLCHDMNIQVIAEGVNNVDQARVLAYLGVDYLQGNVFTLPVDINAVTHLSKEIEVAANQIFKESSQSEDEKADGLMTTVGSIASHGLPSLEPRDTISLANEYFKTQTVSVLPVIVDKKCVGIIDRALLCLHLTPTMGTDLETEKESRVWKRRVNFLMNVEFNSVEATLDIQSLLNLIGEKNYQLPLVLTKRGLYVGILTDNNLMDYLLRKVV